MEAEDAKPRGAVGNARVRVHAIHHFSRREKERNGRDHEENEREKEEEQRPPLCVAPRTFAYESCRYTYGVGKV